MLGMFRLTRLFFYLIILAGIFLAFVMWNGGEKIRWFGKKSEEIGRTIKEKSDEIGDKSDKIREDVLGKKRAVEETITNVVKAAESIGIIEKEREKKLEN